MTPSAIVVDTSALMAIALNESEAERCIDVLASTETLIISAGTVAEALIVASRRGVDHEINILIKRLGFKVLPITEGDARRVADAYGRWGKGVHAAGLNFGDCFAYVAAKESGAPLLYVGNDFSKTDLETAL